MRATAAFTLAGGKMVQYSAAMARAGISSISSSSRCSDSAHDRLAWYWPSSPLGSGGMNIWPMASPAATASSSPQTGGGTEGGHPADADHEDGRPDEVGPSQGDVLGDRPAE